MGRRAGAGEAGYSLIEVLVSMGVMGVFLAMMTTGVVEVYRVVNRNDAFSTVQSQVNIAFLRLDRQIRYASDLSTEGVSGGNWYVEFLTTYTGSSLCTELRLNAASGQLQQRTWTQGNTPGTSWALLAAGVTSTRPFTFLPSDATYNYPRLHLNLVASAGSGTTAATRTFDVTFTALDATSTSAGVCTEGSTSP